MSHVSTPNGHHLHALHTAKKEEPVPEAHTEHKVCIPASSGITVHRHKKHWNPFYWVGRFLSFLTKPWRNV